MSHELYISKIESHEPIKHDRSDGERLSNGDD